MKIIQYLSKSLVLNRYFASFLRDPRNYESRTFFFIIIMTLEGFYNIFQNIKFKYI